MSAKREEKRKRGERKKCHNTLLRHQRVCLNSRVRPHLPRFFLKEENYRSSLTRLVPFLRSVITPLR